MCFVRLGTRSLDKDDFLLCGSESAPVWDYVGGTYFSCSYFWHTLNNLVNQRRVIRHRMSSRLESHHSDTRSSPITNGEFRFLAQTGSLLLLRASEHVWWHLNHFVRDRDLANTCLFLPTTMDGACFTICFTICLFISPDLDGHRAPKMKYCP